MSCLIQLTGFLLSQLCTSRWTVATVLQMLKKNISSTLCWKWEAACFVAQLPPKKKNNVHRKKQTHNILFSLQPFTMRWNSYGHTLNLCPPLNDWIRRRQETQHWLMWKLTTHKITHWKLSSCKLANVRLSQVCKSDQLPNNFIWAMGQRDKWLLSILFHLYGTQWCDLS